MDILDALHQQQEAERLTDREQVVRLRKLYERYRSFKIATRHHMQPSLPVFISPGSLVCGASGGLYHGRIAPHIVLAHYDAQVVGPSFVHVAVCCGRDHCHTAMVEPWALDPWVEATHEGGRA